MKDEHRKLLKDAMSALNLSQAAMISLVETNPLDRKISDLFRHLAEINRERAGLIHAELQKESES